MIVTSGVIPYQYEGVYPFRVPDNHSIGWSGILFEQAMTVQAAEVFRYGGSSTSPKTYDKYINPFIASVPFNPRPDGSNLDGRIGPLPAAAFMDYIDDLRNGLFSVYFFSSADLGGSFANFLTDWLLFVGSASGTIPNFTRSPYSPDGRILSADFTDLGGSGVLADIDLREISYQPYTRMAKSSTSTYKRAGINLIPIFPNFIGTNGAFVSLNSREQALSFTGGGITRTSADFLTGEMILDGDMFYSDTDFCLVPGTATRSNLEGVITHNVFNILSVPGRVFRGNVDGTVDPRARVTVLPPSLPPGGYGIGAIDDPLLHPGLVLPSGSLSFHPSISYTGRHIGSGLYVFDQSFWVQDDDLTFPSGLRLLNPFTRDWQWFRIADQTNVIDSDGLSHAWSSQTTGGLMDNGASYVKMATLFDPIEADFKMGFFQYDKNTLDLTLSQPTQDWGSLAPGVVLDASFDGSHYYAFTVNEAGRNIFIFDGGFALVDSKIYLAQAIEWIQGGIFGGGGPYASIGDRLIELIIDSDTGNDLVTDTGVTYTVDVSVPEWPTSHVSPVVEIHSARNISSSTHFNTGTWLIAENALNTIVMFRAILSGTSILPLEGFVLDLPNNGASRGYQFVQGGYHI